jgi:hypothetical protein
MRTGQLTRYENQQTQRSTRCDLHHTHSQPDPRDTELATPAVRHNASNEAKPYRIPRRSRAEYPDDDHDG